MVHILAMDQKVFGMTTSLLLLGLKSHLAEHLSTIHNIDQLTLTL